MITGSGIGGTYGAVIVAASPPCVCTDSSDPLGKYSDMPFAPAGGGCSATDSSGSGMYCEIEKASLTGRTGDAGGSCRFATAEGPGRFASGGACGLNEDARGGRATSLFLASGGDGNGLAETFFSSVDTGDWNEDGLAIFGDAEVSTVNVVVLVL